MLTALDIENFKPFGSPQKARLAPLTLVYGPNSGGKSSIIQALLLLRQSFGDQLLPLHPLVPRGEYVDLGSFKALLHRHDLNRTLRIGASFTAQGLAQLRRGPVSTIGFPLSPRSMRRVGADFVAIGAADSRRADYPQLSCLEYWLSPEGPGSDGAQPLNVELIPSSPPVEILERFRLHREKYLNCFGWKDDESIRSYAAFLLSRAEVRSDLEDLWAGGTLVRTLGRITGTRIQGNKAKYPNLATLVDALKFFLLVGRGTLPTLLLPETGTPDASKERPVLTAAPGLDQLDFEFRSLLRSLEYLGPLRSYPARHYLLGGAHVESVGTRGENTPQMLYYRSAETLDAINDWFRTFELPYKVDLQKIGNEVVGEMIVVQLLDRRTKTQVTPSDVGFGLGQLLPVLVQGMISSGQILCVEQPEIHLHPKLQGTLGDFFLWASDICGDGFDLPRRSPNTNQWIVETHSESLILRILKRIRDGFVKPQDVSVLYVNPVEEFGAEILELRISPEGRFIDEWPHGFFEESFQELFA